MAQIIVLEPTDLCYRAHVVVYDEDEVACRDCSVVASQALDDGLDVDEVLDAFLRRIPPDDTHAAFPDAAA
jgi:hypothetical protein